MSVARSDSPAATRFVATAGNGLAAAAADQTEAVDNDRLLEADAGPDADSYPHLHNLLQLTRRIFLGGEPHGDLAFAELKRLGVKTVVSVDGATPHVDAAKKHGLDYVHIPIGYDGVGERAGLSLARLMRDREGPFYIHCHHGKHRGPAAAAVACVASGATDGTGALAILERAGTSKGYAGLWRDVQAYQPPAADRVLPELVEVAEVGSMAIAMVQIARAKDNLALSQQERWSVPVAHPDVAPAQEALLLREALHETGRNLSDDYDGTFKAHLSEAERIAVALEAALKEGQPETADAAFKTLLKSCRACHAEYRD